MKRAVILLILPVLINGCATIWNNPERKKAYCVKHGITEEMQEQVAKNEWATGMNPAALGLIFGYDIDQMQRNSLVYKNGNISCYKFKRNNRSYYFYFTNDELVHWSEWNKQN